MSEDSNMLSEEDQDLYQAASMVFSEENFSELISMVKHYIEMKKYQDKEIENMRSWIKRLEEDKQYFINEREHFKQRAEEIEKNVVDSKGGKEELLRKIADLENEKAKLNYRMNKYLSNKKIAKIIESNKLDQF